MDQHRGVGDLQRPIGVYDSGVGGLTVLKALQDLLPQENFVYVADTARAPYGPRSAEEIRAYTQDILSWFHHDVKVKMVVGACHTSSALAIPTLQPFCPFPLVDTICPLLETVLSQPYKNRIGLWATEASVKSRAHERLFKEKGFLGILHSIPCPNLVPLIEQMPWDESSLRAAIQEYLKPLVELDLDTLIFGCTHYPFLRPLVQSLAPRDLFLLDPAEAIATRTLEILKENHLINPSVFPGQVSYVVTKGPQEFQEKITHLGIEVPRPVTLASFTQEITWLKKHPFSAHSERGEPSPTLFHKNLELRVL